MKLSAILLSIILFVSCNRHDQTIKVAATPSPHAEMLFVVQEDLKKEGINLIIVEIADYNIPNRSLHEKEVDANFFQHAPFLKEQAEEFGYTFSSLGAIHIEPMGIYSSKIDSLSSLASGSVVSLPSDPSNEYRSLLLLQENNLLTLRPTKGGGATILDIQENPKNLRFVELDAAMLPRSLPDVDIAVIPTNFALQGGLDPKENALALEEGDSLYANILVVRAEDAHKEELLLLKKALSSEKMEEWITLKYNGAILPSSQAKKAKANSSGP